MHLADTVSSSSPRARLQRRRRAFQFGFFVLFLVAPALDWLRFDLHETQLWFLGQRWSLGLDAFQHGQATATQTAWSIVLRGFVPAIAAVVGFMAVAWRYGRLYCGWLCPHFSMVELLNGLLHRAAGKFSLWDRRPTLRAGERRQARYWPLFALACALMGFAWAITLLSYLLPPAEIWGGLLHGTLTPNQARFLAIASSVFTLEFAFARHLFCRFGCAVGLFQSLAWMANPKGMVVAFKRESARQCRTCGVVPPDRPGRSFPEGSAGLGAARRPAASGSACDTACPMRLHPRDIKRMMFSCVQCGQCMSACESSQGVQQRAPLLQWAVGVDAVRETLRQKKAEQAEHAQRQAPALLIQKD